MNLGIHNPELVRRVNAQINSEHFHDLDDLIEKALDALDERTPDYRNGRGVTGRVAGVSL